MEWYLIIYEVDVFSLVCVFLCALSKNIFLNLKCAFLYPYIQWITMQLQNISQWLVYTLGLISSVFFYNP